MFTGPRPGDRVLFGPTCAVAGCPGRGVNRSLGLKAKGANHSTGTMFRGYICLAHVDMWRRDGEPPIDAWVRHAARARRGQVVPDRCMARGCRRSVYQHGFCGAQASLRPCGAARRSRRVRSHVHAGSDQRGGLSGGGLPLPGDRPGRLLRRASVALPQRPAWPRDLTPVGYLEHLADARRISAPKFDMRGVPAVVALELAFALQQRRRQGCDGASDRQPGRAMGR